MPRARCPTAAKFDGMAGLRRRCWRASRAVHSTVREKLLMYAMGRNLQYYDAPAVRAIVRGAAHRQLHVRVAGPGRGQEPRRSRCANRTQRSNVSETEADHVHHEESAFPAAPFCRASGPRCRPAVSGCDGRPRCPPTPHAAAALRVPLRRQRRHPGSVDPRRRPAAASICRRS